MKIKYWILSVFFAAGVVNAAEKELRLAVHNSFELPQELLSQFEKQHQVKLSIIKAGDGNEMLNKLILSRAHPIADAVYGLDNVNILKAKEEGILAEQQPESLPVAVSFPTGLAIDYGYVNINYDKAWFEKNKKPLPSSLEELTQPEYKGLLAVPNPSTSTPGLAFLMANIEVLGEDGAFEWWAKMRQNGVKISEGWSDAYYNQFTQNGGAYPLVVSYATSPAAEVFFSKGKYQEPPTGNLFLRGGVFQQTEGAAVLKDAQEPRLAADLLQYLQSENVQQEIPTAMWIYPAVKDTPLPEVFRFAEKPQDFSSLSEQATAEQQKAWINRWIQTVLH